MTDAPDLLQAALDYAADGWAVFPVWSVDDGGRCRCPRSSTCDNAGKHPVGHLAPHAFKNATRDPEQLRAWWKRGAWNIGGATGQASGRCALDVDPRHGGEATLRELEAQYGALPHTRVHRTGRGGHHYIFRVMGPCPSRALGLGVELKGDGAAVVLPPSQTAGPYAVERADPEALFAPASWNGATDESGTRERFDTAAALAGVPEGERDTTAWGLACKLRQADVPQDVALRIIEEMAANCTPPFPAEVAREKVVRAYRRYPPGGAHAPENGTAEPPAGSSNVDGPALLPLTDTGNAERLAARYGADLRCVFSDRGGRWYVWTAEEGRWRADDTGAIRRYAKATVRTMYREAADIPVEAARKALATHALRSESKHAITAMIELAQSEPHIAVRETDFDRDPWLLNVKNGTVDLRTGELRPHRRTDLITRLAPVVYDASARLDTWERFLADVTSSDKAQAAFLQRACGYTLSGSTAEEKVFLGVGDAGTGKSTFAEAIKAALGDYTRTADFESFLVRARSGTPRNDIARLRGARMVVAVEVEQGKQFATALVKVFTGGDSVAARFLYREAFEFIPTAKVWLLANIAPDARDDDSGFWRRILRVPFQNVIPRDRQDPGIKATLRDPERAGPAILAWMVEGCLAWQQHGLGSCPSVEQATAAYRDAMDPMAEFFTDRCMFGPEVWIPQRDFRHAYVTWTSERQQKALDPKEVGERLRRRGCTTEQKKVGGKNTKVWAGVGLQMDLDL
jgi:putative DNA primase/helicase